MTVSSDLAKVDQVVSNDIKFCAKLQIGESAYGTLRAQASAKDLWILANSVFVGARIASLPAFAATGSSSAFAWTGLSMFAAPVVTPILTVVAAGVFAGGAYYGVSRLMREYTSNRVEVVPKFINTPIDVLAVSLFDVICPLALKVAASDRMIVKEERDVIAEYFTDLWGYDPKFVEPAMAAVDHHLDSFSVQQMTQDLRLLTKENPDCNHQKIRDGVVELLSEIGHADGVFLPAEKQMIDDISDGLLGKTWAKSALPNWMSRAGKE